MNGADPLDLAIAAILVVLTFWLIFWLGVSGLDVSDEEQEKLKEQADKAAAERAEAAKKQQARRREMASSFFKWVSSSTGNLTVKDFQCRKRQCKSVEFLR